MVKNFIKLEGLVVFLISFGIYYELDFNWTLFFLLLFVPDIGMLGYIHSKKIGAMIYNTFHTYSLPLFLLFIGFLLNNDFLLSISIIWTAHIGIDRAIGYGLKYTTDFKDTHINKI
ncbi:hypothetical protein CIB95_12920 [Lottiidibacillus patelloidae]|uniref:DUF4260 domain-containing protein n=1 Tax=Lottiidibacillus patelloidae TaxID=2670334 RepID=A0A263BRH8_9BACI|nr:DUF4260 domain-containing protein [Lottiidibacillus patelloidae]OZM56311.1 hypothetical protein CIB95_12920 [Lottiidibacillus patelloidae]